MRRRKGKEGRKRKRDEEGKERQGENEGGRTILHCEIRRTLMNDRKDNDVGYTYTVLDSKSTR